MKGDPSKPLAAPSIEEELSNSRIQDAPSGWPAHLFKRRSVGQQSAASYVKQSPFYIKGHWDVTEERVSVVDDMGRYKYAPLWDYSERSDRVNHRFMDIFNDIIKYYDPESLLKTLVSQSSVYDGPHYTSKGKPVHYKTGADLIIHAMAPGTYDEMEVDLNEPYRACIALGNVERVNRNRYDPDPLKKIAQCARECLEQQPSRRFVFAFYVSRTSFQLYYFDHVGVVKSAEIDINQDAVTFVQAVQFLANPTDPLAFDSNNFCNKGNQRCIKVLSGGETITYEVDRLLFRHPAMFGGVTTCWVVRTDGTRKQLMMKDKWQGKEWGTEVEMLTVVRKARVPGVVQLVLFDETHPADKPMSTAFVRQSLGIYNPEDQNLMFTRTVLELHGQGQSISHFESGLQLLQAFRDAINGHYHLVKAGILHRDISADNILLGEQNAPVGQRAILIDLGRATRCDRGRCPPESDVITGTFMFRSVNNLTGALRQSLKGRQRHDFVDDLESFFWVYVWITTVYNGPGEGGVSWDKTVQDAKFLQASTSVGLSRHWKQLYLSKFNDLHFDDMTSRFFSEPVYLTLLDDLRRMMDGFNSRKRAREKDANGVRVEVDFFPEMEEIYGKVFGYFDAAIESLSPSATAGVQPDREVKRPREDDPSPLASPKAKKARVAEELEEDASMEL